MSERPPPERTLNGLPTTRLWLLLCGIPVIGFSLLCCGSSALWMMPRFLMSVFQEGEWLGWSLFYGTFGLVGLGFGTVVLFEARAVGQAATGGDLIGWATNYRRSTTWLALGSSLLVLLSLVGTAMGCFL